MQKQNIDPKLINKILENIFFNPSHPSSFSSLYRLYKSAIKIEPNIKLKNVREWLQSNRTYTLFRKANQKFRRRPVLVRGPFHQYQADLMDYQAISRENWGVKFLLTIIDCFTRFALIIPLKSKRGNEIAQSLDSAFDVMGNPTKLQTDQGGEFYNYHVKRLLKEKNIIHFSTYQDVKAQMVERFNRTVREKIAKIINHNNSLKYIEFLPDIMLAYNSRPHSSLDGFQPRECNLSNRNQIYEILYGDYLKEKTPVYRFSVGDKVRITAFRKTFKKSSDKNFTESIYQVAEVLKTNPPTYKLISLKDNEKISGSFYDHELQRWTGEI